jgi:glycerol-3-phosphate acyltransferase PlsY
MSKIILLVIIGYFIGSIPSGLIVGKLTAGIDIRNYGSGNLGGTNAFRVLGTKGGLIVTSADIIKGIIPTLIGLSWAGEVGAIIGGASAIFGHAYPIFAGLRGGKSIATGTGVFLILMPHIIGISAIVFAIVLITTNYVSLASLSGALILVIFSIILKQGILKIIACCLVFIFVVYRHRGNIERLLYGRENKVKLWKRRP